MALAQARPIGRLVANFGLAALALLPPVGALLLAFRLSEGAPSLQVFLWPLAFLVAFVSGLSALLLVQRTRISRLRDDLKAKYPEAVVLSAMRLNSFTQPFAPVGVSDLPKYLCILGGDDGLSLVSSQGTVARLQWADVVEIRAEDIRGAQKIWAGITISARRNATEAILSVVLIEGLSVQGAQATTSEAEKLMRLKRSDG
jgi:hypothetical protein